MTNTVRMYKSTDGSAPVLTGQVNSLVALLKAILVDGYGSKTAAGWTQSYSTTNKASFLQNTTGSNNASGMHIYVDDTGPGAGGAKEARVCGFETMSAITPTGTGQFPTSSQSTIGVGTLVIRKSTTADSTARAWTCVADGHTFYLTIETGDFTAPLLSMGFAFGDFFPSKSADSYAVMIIGRNVENSSTVSNEWLGVIGMQNAGGAVNPAALICSGHFVARSWTGVGGSKNFSKQIDQTKMLLNNGSQSSAAGATNNAINSTIATTAGVAIGRSAWLYFPYPNAADGALWLSPVNICHDGCWRGWLKGFWSPLHDRPLNHNDDYTVSSGLFNGKSFIVQSILTGINNASDQAQPHIEYSDTWAAPQ